eukprot:g56721.t1
MNINPPAGFWKSWTAVEKKAPTEHKDAQLLRVSAGLINSFVVYERRVSNKDGVRTSWVEMSLGWIEVADLGTDAKDSKGSHVHHQQQ